MKTFKYSVENYITGKEPFTGIITAETAGKARYKLYLKWSDVFCEGFSEFIKITKIRAVHG